MSPTLSIELANRASRLVALDPSENVLQNPYADAKIMATVEDAHLDEKFDLATLRMVAEHLPDPRSAIESLTRLVSPGGFVVIYTPYRWSPVSVASSLVPNRLHHHITGFLWGTLEEDVFPTHYRMNTRGAIRNAFEGYGFNETLFAHLANCQVFHRWRLTSQLELVCHRAIDSIGIRYPETELLAVYRRDTKST
jgi:SAM-dependent methyltransferase